MMKFLIISGNPKKDGLCHSVMEEVIRGAKDGGADVSVFDTTNIPRCHTCNGGWGTCLEKHTCSFGKDGDEAGTSFDDGQQAVAEAGAYCIITPTYWHEMSEPLKAFLDRLRRCEASKHFGNNGQKTIMEGKQTLLIASPGGTGRGVLNCLEQMEAFCQHVGAVVFDHIGINRWNNDYKKQA
ncbi:MAG: NAD(P)H-dependent oxidoreductase, partial [Spirochaetaceae bacterium]|nr:NAD(P)H-dependent oxidoreductase [Spirochaetaceae bacterium]